MPLKPEEYLNGIKNDLKIAIDDVIGVIAEIHEDVEKLKVKTSWLNEYCKEHKCTQEQALSQIINRKF